MKTAILTVIGTLIVSSFVGSTSAQTDHQPQPQADTSMKCVEKLDLPTYPVLARSARIEGSITALVALSPQGTVQSIKSQAVSTLDRAKRLLVEPVEQAIRGTVFRSDCHEKTVTLVFYFRITGRPSNNPKQSTSFGFPNRFWIITEPATVQP
jgi:hypothetical protein